MIANNVQRTPMNGPEWIAMLEELIRQRGGKLLAVATAATIKPAALIHELHVRPRFGESVTKVVAQGLEDLAKNVPAKATTGSLVGKGASEMTTTVAKNIAKAAKTEAAEAVAKGTFQQVTKTAAREIGRNVGRAAGIAAIIDAGFAAVKAARNVKSGEWTLKQAAAHVGREAGIGAVSGAVAVAAVPVAVVVAGVSVATGPAFVVAGLAGLGSRQFLDQIVPGKPS